MHGKERHSISPQIEAQSIPAGLSWVETLAVRLQEAQGRVGEEEKQQMEGLDSV